MTEYIDHTEISGDEIAQLWESGYSAHNITLNDGTFISSAVIIRSNPHRSYNDYFKDYIMGDKCMNDLDPHSRKLIEVERKIFKNVFL